jgi:hypothetical protein
MVATGVTLRTRLPDEERSTPSDSTIEVADQILGLFGR